jgi:hypothetical protein
VAFLAFMDKESNVTRTTATDRCTCEECGVPILPGRRIYYGAGLPFCSARHAQDFDSRSLRALDRALARDRTSALRYARKAGLLRAG